MQAWSNRLLALISVVSIVFCCATFKTLSTRQVICYFRFGNDQQKHWRKSTEPKPGLFMPLGFSLLKACGLVIELVWSNLKLVSRHKKSRLRFFRLSPMFLLIVLKSSAPDVLPNGQCIERCTAKDNAYDTDQCQQTVALCLHV